MSQSQLKKKKNSGQEQEEPHHIHHPSAAAAASQLINCGGQAVQLAYARAKNALDSFWHSIKQS